MRDLYRADQGEQESVTSYATWVEGLLSQMRDKFPDQIPLEKKQELLKDRLFHGSHKSIWDSVKYHHADAKVDYMIFLEECRKAEDGDRIGQSKIKGKLKAAAATILSTQHDEIIKRLKKQQQQIDTLVNTVKTLQTAQALTSFRQQNPSFGMKGRGRNPYTDRRGDPGGRGLPSQSRLRVQPLPQRPPFQPRLLHPQQEQGTVKTYSDNQCWQCGEVGHLKRTCPMPKGKGLFQGGSE